jgi:hypothetical protein
MNSKELAYTQEWHYEQAKSYKKIKVNIELRKNRTYQQFYAFNQIKIINLTMKANRISLAAALMFAVSFFMQVANALYFYAEPDVWRCFQDTVVSNYVSFFPCQN